MPKLYIGAPMTTVSAALSSAMSSFESAWAAAWAALAGSAPRSAVAESSGQVRDRAAAEIARDDPQARVAATAARETASWTSWLETDASPSALLVRTRTVDMTQALLSVWSLRWV